MVSYQAPGPGAAAQRRKAHPVSAFSAGTLQMGTGLERMATELKAWAKVRQEVTEVPT